MVRMILGIIHYVGCFLLFFGGAFFSRLSRSRDDRDDDDDDEWETYMSTRNGIFFFLPVIYISCAANRFFFPSFPPKKLYV